MKQRLQSLATGRNILILIGLYVALVVFVLTPAERFLKAHSTGDPPLDLKMFYGPDEAYPELVQLDEEGRAFYRRFEMSWDLVYPVLYTLLFSLLWLFLLRRAFPSGHFVQRLWFVPLLPIGLDYLENACIVSMLNGLPEQSAGLAQAASVFSALKWIGFLTAFLLILVGLAAWGMKRFRKAG
jgi:hypothetical protein